MKPWIPGFAVLLLGITTARQVDAAAYIFAGETYGVDLVTHPMGYTGNAGTLIRG
jgi:hypothetical protein